MREGGLLRRRGQVGRHEAEMGVFKVGTSKGVEGGTNVEERVDG